jgi:hypothetical protein
MIDLCSLRSRYNKQIKRLGQTGAGLTLDDLQRTDRTKGLISKVFFLTFGLGLMVSRRNCERFSVVFHPSWLVEV